MDLINILSDLRIPAAYGKFDKPPRPPFAVYLGAGQQRFFGDNTIFSKVNDYTLEYYFVKKSEAREDELEAALLANDYIYEKSEDDYIDEDDIFVIYYTLWRKHKAAAE